MQDSTPTLCECGCGQPTRIAPQTNKRLGWVKGEPIRFIRGHSGGGTKARVPLARRFEGKVDRTGSCWLWKGAITNRGYGVIYDPDRDNHRMAHRVAWEIYVGPIPDGFVLDHLCRNTKCVNPDHLEPVTQKENVRRGRRGVLKHLGQLPRQANTGGGAVRPTDSIKSR